MVGEGRVELPPHAPHARILPLDHSPQSVSGTSYDWTIPCTRVNYLPLLFFKRVFLQRVQALTLSPDANVAHWRLGFFDTFGVGLYFDISLLYFLPITGPLPQISQTLLILEFC